MDRIDRTRFDDRRPRSARPGRALGTRQPPPPSTLSRGADTTLGAETVSSAYGPVVRYRLSVALLAAIAVVGCVPAYEEGIEDERLDVEIDQAPVRPPRVRSSPQRMPVSAQTVAPEASLVARRTAAEACDVVRDGGTESDFTYAASLAGRAAQMDPRWRSLESGLRRGSADEIRTARLICRNLDDGQP